MVPNAPKGSEMILSSKAIQIFNKNHRNYVKMTQKQRGRSFGTSRGLPMLPKAQKRSSDQKLFKSLIKTTEIT